jgi:hypothetical protein
MVAKEMRVIQKTKIVIAIAFLMYLSLWLLTARYGALEYRRWLIAKAEHISKAEDVSAVTNVSKNLRDGQYYFHTIAVAPFLISYDIGYKCGALCGFGGKGIVFWLPNSFPEISSSDWWKA